MLKEGLNEVYVNGQYMTDGYIAKQPHIPNDIVLSLCSIT